MYESNKILVVIPARGGSKGLHRKNIRNLGGKPLIAWSIEQASQSRYVDQVIVSTEDVEISEVAQVFGASIPFMRPPELATDTASGVDVLCHAVESAGNDFDLVVLLQPTSPLRNSEDIDAAIELCVKRSVSSVVSIAEATKSPFWMYQMDSSAGLIPFADEAASNRQQLPRCYALNGAVYVFKVQPLLETKKILSQDTLGYEMPIERSFDIDTELDFDICEMIKLKGHSAGE